jgi:hypothetical protein
MRKLYIGLTGALLAAVVLQFAFAGVGAFTKPQTDSSFALHQINGMAVIPALALLATIVAAVLKLPGRQIGLTILPLGLTFVQVIIVLIGNALRDNDGQTTTPASLVIYSLHAINGLAIMGVAGRVLALARRTVPVPA